MARSTENGSIGPSHRRVLELLASAPQGRAEPSFIAVFTVELLALIGAGLVDARAETVRKGGRTIETARVRITAAGRKLIEE
jgi:hypothetical protein